MRKSNIMIAVFVSLLIVILAMVLLTCTVFVVRHISVEAAVSSDLINEEDIRESSGIAIGRSIISINKAKSKAEIEKANPYVEVLDIVRRFPNKVIIKATVRTAIMKIASSDMTCGAIVDSSLKILEVVSYDDFLAHGATKVEGVTFDPPALGALSLVGSKFDFSEDKKGALLPVIASSAEEPALDLSGTSFLTFFKKIDIREDGENLRVYITTNTGVILVLDTSLSTSIYQQLYLCNYVYTSEDTSKDLSRGYIALDKDSSVVAYKWMENLE